MKKPTIRDVAREAGVSVATVSRVLNNKPDASGEARKKVEQAIDALGYARSSQWVQLTSGKSRAIALHFPNTGVDPNPVYLAFISGATAACEERGYRLLLLTRPLGEDDLLDLYRSSTNDGTILMKVELDDPRVAFLDHMELPFVMIGHTESEVRASFVDYDFEAAIGLGLDHLVSLGHRKIGYVSTTPAGHVMHGPTVRALRAYEEACRAIGIPALHYQTDQDLRSVRVATAGMLNDHPDVTAIMTLRELVETAIYGAVSDAGLRIPQDVSVVGLANAQGLELTSPALTALDFPAYSMAYEAGSMLIDQLEGVDTRHREVLRKPTLTVRASTGPARPGF